MILNRTLLCIVYNVEEIRLVYKFFIKAPKGSVFNVNNYFIKIVLMRCTNGRLTRNLRKLCGGKLDQTNKILLYLLVYDIRSFGKFVPPFTPRNKRIFWTYHSILRTNIISSLSTILFHFLYNAINPSV